MTSIYGLPQRSGSIYTACIRTLDSFFSSVESHQNRTSLTRPSLVIPWHSLALSDTYVHATVPPFPSSSFKLWCRGPSMSEHDLYRARNIGLIIQAFLEFSTVHSHYSQNSRTSGTDMAKARKASFVARSCIVG